MLMSLLHEIWTMEGGLLAPRTARIGSVSIQFDSIPPQRHAKMALTVGETKETSRDKDVEQRHSESL